MTNDIGRDQKANLVVAVGASAGGLREIVKIVGSLPPRFDATMVIANHRLPDRKNLLLDVVASCAEIAVLQPEDEDSLACTTIYIGDSRDSVKVVGDAFSVRQDTTAASRSRRIDDLFISVANSAGRNAVGVILSGRLIDGIAGLRAIHEAGGECLVQTPEQAEYESMPTNAIANVPADLVGSTDEIAARIIEIGRRSRDG